MKKKSDDEIDVCIEKSENDGEKEEMDAKKEMIVID